MLHNEQRNEQRFLIGSYFSHSVSQEKNSANLALCSQLPAKKQSFSRNKAVRDLVEMDRRTLTRCQDPLWHHRGLCFRTCHPTCTPWQFHSSRPLIALVEKNVSTGDGWMDGWTSTPSEKWCKQMKWRMDFSERLEIPIRSIFPGMTSRWKLYSPHFNLRNSIILNILIVES